MVIMVLDLNIYLNDLKDHMHYTINKEKYIEIRVIWLQNHGY